MRIGRKREKSIDFSRERPFEAWGGQTQLERRPAAITSDAVARPFVFLGPAVKRIVHGPLHPL